MTLLKIWFLGQSVLVQSCLGPKFFWTEVFPGQSRHRAEVFLRPKCASWQSMIEVKVSAGPKWSWGQTGCEPIIPTR